MEIKIVYKKCNEIDIEATTENWKISLEKEINKEKLKNNYTKINLKERNGHAWEFAIILAAKNFLTENGNSFLIHKNDTYNICENHFLFLSINEQCEYNEMAKQAVFYVCEREPKLKYPTNDKLELTLQSDDKGKGKTGDVRDIVFIRSSQGWEIGISAKHNSNEIKGNRIPTNGNLFKNFGFEPSISYQNNFIKINEFLSNKSGQKWSNLLDSETEYIYSLALNIIVNEFNVLCTNDNFAASVCSYYLANKNHWKISKFNKSLIIEAINFCGTLNKPSDNILPIEIIKLISLPKKILKCGILPQKKSLTNTMFIEFDNGLMLTGRIHNGDTNIKIGGLKFTVEIINYPIDYYKRELK